MAYDAEEFKGPGGVNVAECLRVANQIERSSTFDMGQVLHDCKTPACIAGHVAVANGFVRDPKGDHINLQAMRFAREVLALQPQQAADLFCATSCVFGTTAENYDGMAATPAHAAACLRKLAETGEVDWLGTKPSPAA